eukprot:scaffold207611_cov48-Prasinocladus_malaysianus.AAC.1
MIGAIYHARRRIIGMHTGKAALTGPTLTMRIHKYSLMRDVLGAQQRPHCPKAMFETPPLIRQQFSALAARWRRLRCMPFYGGFESHLRVVMNNFGNQEELRLASTMFQNLFPSINVTKVKLKTCQLDASWLSLDLSELPEHVAMLKSVSQPVIDSVAANIAIKH